MPFFIRCSGKAIVLTKKKLAMATSSSTSRHGRTASRHKGLSYILFQTRSLFRYTHPGWILSFILFIYIVMTSSIMQRLFPRAFDPLTHLIEREADADIVSGHFSQTVEEASSAKENSGLLQDGDLMRSRLDAAQANNSSPMLGNHFCVLQPTLSAGKSKWSSDDARNHIALRAFLRTFASTVTQSERERFRFSIYYGHDSDDAVFGSASLRGAFLDQGRKILSQAGFTESDVKFVFTPLYGLHGRINAIWNMLAKDAYYDGCDYYFMSNDDMVFFTRGWVTSATDSLNGKGSRHGHKRPCRYFGIVRFKDEWASWATFTFHVSTRMHLEIFGGTYYPVPYNSAHNDYWIYLTYRFFDASKYRGEVKVRNRVEDVDYALAHHKDTSRIAPPRYTYDKRGDVRKYILEGRARVQAWLKKYKGTEWCPPPL